MVSKRFYIKGLSIFIGIKSRLNEGGLEKALSFPKKDLMLGITFVRRKIVGKKNFQNPSEWGKNLVNSYNVRIGLIILDIAISWDINGKHIEI